MERKEAKETKESSEPAPPARMICPRCGSMMRRGVCERVIMKMIIKHDNDNNNNNSNNNNDNDSDNNYNSNNSKRNTILFVVIRSLSRLGSQFKVSLQLSTIVRKEYWLFPSHSELTTYVSSNVVNIRSSCY